MVLKEKKKSPGKNTLRMKRKQAACKKKELRCSAKEREKTEKEDEEKRGEKRKPKIDGMKWPFLLWFRQDEQIVQRIRHLPIALFLLPLRV